MSTTKLLTENILTEDNFLSATEQEGLEWETPEADASNSGSMDVYSSGTPSDESYSGTADSTGTTTTLIDSNLKIYGDDFLIGWTISFTSGSNNGLSRTITDFDGSTGTITWSSPVTAATASGDSYTISLAAEDCDFVVELTGSGDPGAATFKWSFDGGSTYFGRQPYTTANWDTENGDYEIQGTSETDHDGSIIELDDRWLAIVYVSGTTDYAKVYESTDLGRTWSFKTNITDIGATEYIQAPAIRLSSGRIVCVIARYLYYSDDDGATWTKGSYTGIGAEAHQGGLLELSDGTLALTYANGNSLYYKTSTDQGATWGASSTVRSQSGYTFTYPRLCETADGNLLVAFKEYTGAAYYNIIYKSEDSGSSWSQLHSDNVAYSPQHIWEDGSRLYLLSQGYLKYSDDSGDSWSSWIDVRSATGSGGSAVILSSKQIAAIYDCRYVNRCGAWEAYSSGTNEATAPASGGLDLICSVSITFAGSGGISGDKWTWGPSYEFAAKNIISDSPQRTWRSTQDGIECNIVIDLGPGKAAYVDSVAVFGCNVQYFYLQFNDSDSWSSPIQSTHLTLLVASGQVDSVSGNMIKDTSLFTTYSASELKNYRIVPTSGADYGKSYRILNNLYDYVVLDTDSLGMVAGDTFTLRADRRWYAISAVLARYMRINIPAQVTPDGYYEIGCFMPCKNLALPSNPLIGYGSVWVSGVQLVDSVMIGPIGVNMHDAQRGYTLTWKTDNPDQILGILDYARGRNLVLLLDDSSPQDCLLVKLQEQTVQLRHIFGDWHEISCTFREVL